MIDFLTALWLGGVGACVGSFLNVVAYRVPRGMSVVWKPSHCPRCGRAIRWHDNVPIFGWLWLGGRCRDCKGPISSRYAIVETITGAAFFALAYVDLYAGGGKLPGTTKPLAPGAWHSVWNPDWPLLGWYAYHAVLVCTAIVAVLTGIDAQAGKKRTAIKLCVLAALFALPYWRGG